MLLLFSIRELTHRLFEKELFLRFTVRVFRERLPFFVCVFFSLLVLILLIPDHCISIYFPVKLSKAEVTDNVLLVLVDQISLQ